jgi:hypothetical protein
LELPRSCFQQLHHIGCNGRFQLSCLGIEHFQFFVEGFQLLFEILIADLFAWSDTDVTTGI